MRFRIYSNFTLFLIVLSFQSLPLKGQKTEFEHISDKEGLLNSTVTAILKDSEGYMWFGTFNGVTRYDGYSFTNFLHDPKNPNSINNSHIRCLLESKDSVLFVATEQDGFSTYNRNTESFTRYSHQKGNSNSLGHNSVLSMFEDSHGNLWLGTVAGLDKFDYRTKSFKHYFPFGQNFNNRIANIVEDKEGNLWLYGHSNSLCRFNPVQNTFGFLKFSDNPKTKEEFNYWGVLCYDKRGNLWIGNHLDGLIKLNVKTGAREEYSMRNKKLESDFFTAVKEDSKGDIWVTTDGGGLFNYDHQSNSFKVFQNDPDNLSSLGSNAVYCFYESEPGLYWIGTYEAGISVLKSNRKKILKFTANGEAGKKLPQKCVLAFAPAKDGKVWVGTDGGGLSLFDPKTYEFKYYTEENGGVCANVVKSLLADKENNLWCGSFRKGLCKINIAHKSKVNFTSNINKENRKLFNDHVWAIGEIDQDKIWMGLLAGGIDVYDNKSQTISRSVLDTIGSGELGRTTVFVIMKDSKKRIWIGTETMGAICYDPASDTYLRFKFENEKNTTIRSNDVRDIFEDSKGNFWFATGRGGLNKLLDINKNLFQSYTMKDGLPSDHILAILEDDKNNLWLSSDKGISCFKVKERKFLNFGVEDGLQSLEFRDCSKLKTGDGFMYFGGIDGFNMFHPDSLHINTVSPMVVISDFKIFDHSLKNNVFYNGKAYADRSISKATEIVLNPEDLVFSIEFAALSFIYPAYNRYAYKLEGFDNNWTYVNADKRFASYTNLNPGEYIFRVMAANKDGIWNQKVTSLKIIVLPPWWMTWWFKIVMILFTLGGISLLIYLRTRSVREKNRMLEEEVRKRTADLLESKNEVMRKNIILEQNNQEMSKKTERILEQQEEILRQKSEVEQLNRTKDKFFSIIAHDLRNPVYALNVLSKEIRKEFQPTGALGRELMNHMEVSSERVKDLVLNLLEWTKTQTGNIKVNPAKNYVYNLIEENIELHSPQASQKQINISVMVDDSLFMIADYNMVNTIIRNVLGNAIKYTPRRGQIEIFSYTDQDEVILAFRDSGVGIPGDELDRLINTAGFVSKLGTDNEIGTGLGLTISREFAELNNGNIYAESKPGEGSTFYLCLPGGKDELNSRRESKDGKHTDNILINEETGKLEEIFIKDAYKRKKILVVDDDEQVRTSIKHILADLSEVLEAIDVKNAISLSEDTFPDLIISDIMMPGETGISLCHSIKKNRITCHIPVILLTGQTSNHTHLEGLIAGADAYITKPFDRNILLSTINNLFTSLENIKFRFSSDPDILPSEYTRNEMDEDLMLRAVRFIENNISDPELNGDTLCKELGISKSVLYSKLKSIAGQTVNEFIRIIRLKKSTILLLEGKLNINQVSSEVGFNSASYYTKSFTSHFGLSPKEYIAKQRN
jgi:signal transduction histidine kinase/ligand-binding sensor domain-containing protein/CheY-like chemotaxis protein/AraC-like DNA-binding protein